MGTGLAGQGRSVLEIDFRFLRVNVLLRERQRPQCLRQFGLTYHPHPRRILGESA